MIQQLGRMAKLYQLASGSHSSGCAFQEEAGDPRSHPPDLATRVNKEARKDVERRSVICKQHSAAGKQWFLTAWGDVPNVVEIDGSPRSFI
jgi:hypothetical protein